MPEARRSTILGLHSRVKIEHAMSPRILMSGMQGQTLIFFNRMQSASKRGVPLHTQCYVCGIGSSVYKLRKLEQVKMHFAP